MRKDDLLIVTDAGATLHLGWDYDIPYTIDPLNGIDVDLQLSQGVGQIGSTVERQNVAGVYRTITGSFWGATRDKNARLFLQALPYHTKGTLYFADQGFTRFVLSKTPYLTQYEPYPCFSMMVYCPRPYWYSLTAQNYQMGGYQAAWQFPASYTSHRYSTASKSSVTNVHNPGSLPVPFTCTLRCISLQVQNPRIVNIRTQESIGLVDTALLPGDEIEIYRTPSDRIAVRRTRDGQQENIFHLLDEDSTLTELASGDNLLKAEADSGSDDLQAYISFYPMEVGILPESL